LPLMDCLLRSSSKSVVIIVMIENSSLMKELG